MKKLFVVVSVLVVAFISIIGFGYFTNNGFSRISLDFEDAGFPEMIRIDFEDAGFPEMIRIDFEDAGFPEMIRIDFEDAGFPEMIRI